MADSLFNLSSLDGSNGFAINGITSGDSSGTSVSNAGDINGDNIADLIIGAAFAASGAGQSYVVFGSTNAFNPNLDLSSLDGSNGFAINGSGTNASGTSVSNAGDINGDNIADLIIGAPGTAKGAGQSYVVFGSTSPFNANFDLSSLDGSNGFAINGINGVNSDGFSDSSGKSVSTAGDINGDNIDDLIIGAPSAASGAGQSYVVFGSTSAFNANLDLSSLNGSNGFAINGSGTDTSGNSVSSAGDVNGDNIADLVIGAQGTGKSYVVFGSTSAFNPSLDLSTLNGSNGFVINANPTDFFGASVSDAGDINNDGIDDLIIGAYNTASGAGESYVIFGTTSGFDAVNNLPTLGTNGFIIKGINANDSSGFSVSAAGDVNDDDIADLIIGAPFAASGAGQSYVVFGSSNDFGTSLDLSNLDESQGFAINGINSTDTSGISVSAAGDINNDGADDLIVGASGASSGAGQSYVIFGTPKPQPQPEPQPQLQPLELKNSGNDVFNIKGDNDTVRLKVAIAGSNSPLVNEFGVYTVDDATGKIDGIAPGQAGYARKALERGQVILSTIANAPNGFSNSSLNSLLEFPSDSNVRFYLVKNSTTENVLGNITPITDVLLSDPSNQKITSLNNNAFSLAWKDSSGNRTNDFQNLVVTIQLTDDPLPLGASLQSRPQGELIDLRDAKQRVKADFVVNREASFNNFVGFYKLADENGGIDTNGDGKGDILTGQAGYAQAAIRQRVAGIDLLVNNQGTASYTGTFEPGSIFAPFIIINGRPDAILDSNPNNDPAVYFSFLGANTDKVDHIRLLGNNTFGFEDLAGGGDKDFNDIIVKASLSLA
jgi:Domain of unknown function (DUF4114)/FG-GAP repeat